MTENYIVFVEQPFKLELKRYPKLKLLGKPTTEMFSWNSEENVRYSSSCFTAFLYFHECEYTTLTHR
jgi:hypothetical protein